MTPAQIFQQFADQAVAVEAARTVLCYKRRDASFDALCRLAEAAAEQLFLEASRHELADTRPVDAYALSELHERSLADLVALARREPFWLPEDAMDDLNAAVDRSFSLRLRELAASSFTRGRA